MTEIDPRNLRIKKNVSLDGIFFCLARVPATERLYYGCSDFGVYELDLGLEKPEPQIFSGETHQSYVTGIALAGENLVSGSYDGRLIWWNRETRESVRDVTAHDKWIRSVVASPDGRLVASVADDMQCKIWNAESGELVFTLSDHNAETPHHYPSMLYTCGFSRDGNLLATADKVGHIVIWNVATGEKISDLEAPVMYTWDPRQRRHSIGGIRSVAFSNDQKLLAVGGIGTIGNIDHLGGPSRIEVFDWESRNRLHEISDDKYKGLVEQLAFSPDDSWFVSAGGDNSGFVSCYETATGKLIHQDKAPMHVHALEADDAFESFVTVGHGRIVSWELTPMPPKQA